jgi:hypothetical protein
LASGDDDLGTVKPLADVYVLNALIRLPQKRDVVRLRW